MARRIARQRRTDPATWGWGLLVWAVAGATLAEGLRLLRLKWAGVDPAVFEADTYAQAILHGLTAGDLAPWTLSDRFWPFFFIAPGIYAHVPLLAVAPGGWTVLAFQALMVALTGPALWALGRARQATPATAALLALTWLLGPLAGVGMAWGWSPYLTACPLGVLGLLALARGRHRWGLGLLALTGAMKVDVAASVGALGLWRAWQRRPDGVWLAGGALVWGAASGLAFLWGLGQLGTRDQDLHLEGAPSGEGLWTLAVILVPLLPVLGLRAAAVALCTGGLALLYTTLLNPANSGMIPVGALLLGVMAWHAPTLRRAAPRAAVAAVLALGCRQLYAPPRVSPLPLTPAGWAWEPDLRGGVLRAWVIALPDDLPLVAFDPALGAVGPHPARVLQPGQPLPPRYAVLLPADQAARLGCGSELVPATDRGPAIHAGVCP